ncbi:MAG: alanine--tRNA ligase [Firmicutes bacterium]|jgi:alanyl-tRNA synthetase|nr:alanine--tRNA ligase [Bacillota bacterium]
MKYMSTQELRESFLRFFEGKGHKRLPSASLVPHGDPTLLLTGAGMVPFKPYFLGKDVPPATRITTCQRCLRTADIDNVGKTDRHGTFFEMLGNFSFGDYFKREAINWAWEFTTEHLKLPKERVWITIYLDDDEAYSIWHDEIKIPKERIVRLGREDNFWEIGVGPCGPCSELHLDRGPEYGCGDPKCKPGCDCERYLEFWNLVFIQFHQDEAGNLTPLEKTGIDTGMGLDRAAAILQGVDSIFDTDGVRCVIDEVCKIAGLKDDHDAAERVALRVIADHVRSVTFLVSDGVLPSNEGRGYVLRRLLRRAARYGRLLGIKGSFIPQVAAKVIQAMHMAYPELDERQDYILKVIRIEEERFQATLDQGLGILQELVKDLKAGKQSRLSGEDAFRLYDTFGFPLELTKEILWEHDMDVDEAGFVQKMEEQRQRARAAREQVGYLGKDDDSVYVQLHKEHETEFVGYDRLEAETSIEVVLVAGQPVDKAQMGQEVELILSQTPFYAASGGQIADTGTVTGGQGAVEVTDVQRPVSGLIVHRGRVTSGSIQPGDTVMATVYQRNRRGAACHHTATHLVHKALKEVIGEHVNQAGSLVEPDRLRFDFTHFGALSQDELDQVEKLVNDAIRENLPVTAREMSLPEAEAQGAIALFDEKYGDRVRVVSIDGYSKELCGGTHVERTGELGIFKIVSETAVAAGVRRIEALTDKAAVKHVAAEEALLRQACSQLQTTPAELPGRIDKLLEEQRELGRELERLKAKLAGAQSEELLQQVVEIGDIPVLAAKVEGLDAAALRTLGDRLREKMGSGVLLLGSVIGEKALFLAMVTPDVVSRGIKAGDIVRVAAQATGGGGGGRADMAQAGGREPAKIDAALKLATESIREQLAMV